MFLTKRGTVALLLIAAFAAFAAGCADDSDETEPAASQPQERNVSQSREREVVIPWGPEKVERPEYLRRANRVCDESWKRMLESFEERYGSATTEKRFAAAARNIFLSSMQFWFDDIAYLDAPPGEKPQVEELLTAMQLAVWKGQEGRVTSPRQFEALFRDYTSQARQYGLSSCLVHVSDFS